MSAPNGNLRVAVLHPGARMHYAVPTLLARAGMLARLYTDICADVGPLGAMAELWPPTLRPGVVARLAGRRLPPEIERRAVRQCATTAVLDYLLRSNGFSRLSRLDSKLCNVVRADGFGVDLLYTQLGNSDLDLVQEARYRGVRVVHEVATGPDVWLWLREEHAYFPGIEPAVALETAAAERARDRLKFSLVDQILVPSDFARKAVLDLGAAPEVVVNVPYGLPEHWYEGAACAVPGRVLFVGIVELLKGVHYLAEATRLLRGRKAPCSVRVVGPYARKVVARPLFEGPEYVGQVPRARVRAEFLAADVFVLPTICDSFALAQLEAMACGVPVITTPNAAALVRDGREGFIVPIRDAKALAYRIEQLVTDRALRERMGQQARARAQEFTWERYGERLVGALMQASPQGATRLDGLAEGPTA